MILGPTMNIQRGPLGGRGFESFSEDPYLTGQIASAIIKGIQYDNGIGATVKHYVCNDLEDERSASDSLVTPRALREIYLEPFRIAIKSNPICLMTGYNKVNGEHVSQSKFSCKIYYVMNGIGKGQLYLIGMGHIQVKSH